MKGFVTRKTFIYFSNSYDSNLFPTQIFVLKLISNLTLIQIPILKLRKQKKEKRADMYCLFFLMFLTKIFLLK